MKWGDSSQLTDCGSPALGIDTSVLWPWAYDQLAVLPVLYNATLENSCQYTDRTIRRYNNYEASIVRMIASYHLQTHN